MASAQAFDFTITELSIRDDLPVAFRAAWKHIASPGAAWSSADRVAIATESRNAWNCVLCSARKDALSPNAVSGEHSSCTGLPGSAVDAIHRITTDSGHLSETWFKTLLSNGVTESQYVEIVGIVGTVVSIDTFCEALGLPLEPFPESPDDEPTGYIPERLKQGGAWVPLLMENDLSDAEKDIYAGMKQSANVLRAMSLVPDEVRSLLRVSAAMYLRGQDVIKFHAAGGRALMRPQIELLAARVSVLNECFY